MPAVFGSVNENQTMTLTAPAGTTFVSVDFASYGTPVNYYTTGGCHAANSKTIVEGYLLGKTGSVNIPATNAVFGDPCTGTAKQLVVVARYSPAPSAINFSGIRNAFYNYTNAEGFNFGTNDANLYNLNYYRGKLYNRQGVEFRFPSTGSIDFDMFYNSDGNCPPPPPPPDPGPGPGPDTCFLGYSLVTMADRTLKRIDEVKVGDRVIGGYGHINTVTALDITHVGNRPIYWINEEHNTTGEHRHWTERGWASTNLEDIYRELDRWYDVVIDNNGNKEPRQLVKFNHTPIHNLVEGDVMICGDGSREKVTSIVQDWSFDYDTPLYCLITDGSHTFIVNNKIVSGWVRDDDFDYNTWNHSNCLECMVD